MSIGETLESQVQEWPDLLSEMKADPVFKDGLIGVFRYKNDFAKNSYKMRIEGDAIQISLIWSARIGVVRGRSFHDEHGIVHIGHFLDVAEPVDDAAREYVASLYRSPLTNKMIRSWTKIQLDQVNVDFMKVQNRRNQLLDRILDLDSEAVKGGF
jgi:hypothetical protein